MNDSKGDCRLRRRSSATTFFRECGAAIYDPDAQTVLGRTPKRCAQCILCYAALYGTLLILFVAALALYVLHGVDKVVPRHSLNESLIPMPGLSFRPRLSSESTLLRLVRSDDAQMSQVISLANDFLRPYEPQEQVGDNYADCGDGVPKSDPTKVCIFKTNWLGDCNQANDYNYPDGTPCLFLRLNKVYNWQPENYDPDDVPDEIQSVWQKDVITVTCDGADPVSKEYIGNDVQYFPMQGWSFNYFPYLNQQGYRSPVVAVLFNSLADRMPIFIECRAWAKNLIQDKETGVGYVSFEIIND